MTTRKESSAPLTGTPEFLAWARHDSIGGHARDALLMLSFPPMHDFNDPNAQELFDALERRLYAIIALATQRYRVTPDGLAALPAPAAPFVPVGGFECGSPLDAFHSHLDVCERCKHEPFNLCPLGTRLLHAAAGSRLIDGAPFGKGE